MQQNFKKLGRKITNYMNKYGRTYCKTLVETYRDEIAKCMDYAIEKYYSSYDPVYYTRSNKMKHGVYKKYQRVAGSPKVYVGGIILSELYYDRAYPVRGTNMENIYKWSVLQGNHGREVVGNYGMDNRSVIYVDKNGKGSFGTGRKKVWNNKNSHYIYGNNMVGSDPNGNPFSPYKEALKHNDKVKAKAYQKALDEANSILKPSIFW